MIEDAVLEDLFGLAAEAIEVPPDGPANVRAGRDALGPRASGRKRTTRWLPRSWRDRPRLVLSLAAAALVTVAIAVSVIGASGGGGPSTVAGGHARLPSSTGVPSGNSSIAQGKATGLGSAAAVPAGAGAAGSLSGGVAQSSPAPVVPGSVTSPKMVPSLPSKVIKTGSVGLRVGGGDLAAAMAGLSTDAAGLGGFVASSTQSTGGSSSGNITLRIPAANFEAMVDDTRRLGTVTSLTTTGQDVTAQYVDLQARINSLQDARSQFQQLLAKAQTIGDILSVESQIDDLQTQIEQLQGQLQVLNDQATYSTLTVQVSEAPRVATVAPPKAPSGLSKAWAHARHSFTHGLESIVAALGGVAVFVIFITALAVLGRLGWTYLRRRLI